MTKNKKLNVRILSELRGESCLWSTGQKLTRAIPPVFLSGTSSPIPAEKSRTSGHIWNSSIEVKRIKFIECIKTKYDYRGNKLEIIDISTTFNPPAANKNN